MGRGRFGVQRKLSKSISVHRSIEKREGGDKGIKMDETKAKVMAKTETEHAHQVALKRPKSETEPKDEAFVVGRWVLG